MRSIALLILAVAAVVAAFNLGSRRDAEPAVSQVPVAASPAPEVTATGTPHAGIDEAAAWRLISDTRNAAGDDTGRQSELLEQRLRRLPPDEIAEFARIRRRLDRRAYTWDLWGAAYVIEDGCSDDCFRDFRAYLISLGPKAYEAALRDPDSLAPIVKDAEEGDWENADDVAPDAYEAVAGGDIPGDSSDLDGSPRGRPWDDDHAEQLVERYPRLAERFR